ncbi:MAG: IS1182 family transposase, partial [Bacillota bacterium]
RLHDWAETHLDESMFAPLFDARTGRPSVSPVHTFLALLVQMEKGYSDREMEETSRFDDRVKLAILAGRDFEGIDAVTLCDHRRRFLQHGIGELMLEATLASAKEAGLFSPERSQIVDSFLIHGGAAVQDTYTLIRKAILRVLAVARMHELEVELSPVLKRTDYAQPGKPKIDWEDPEARRALLQELVDDALALVAKARALPKLPEDLRAMVDLLERVATQDIERDPDGTVRLKRGVAKDRVISVVDPEMRHGHKTASNRADGYKAHVMTGGTQHQLVTAVEVTPANAPDDAKLEAMLETQDQQGHRPEEVLGDSAYFDVARSERQAEKGTQIVAKAPPAVNREGYFSKEAFAFDAEAGTLTCPGEQTVRFDPGRLQAHKEFVVSFPAEACGACPLKARCTPAAARQVTMHPYEAALREARAIQKTPAFRARYRLRARIERIVRLLKTHGARKARYWGRIKVRFQLLLAAVNHNVKEVMAAGPPVGEVCPA